MRRLTLLAFAAGLVLLAVLATRRLDPRRQDFAPSGASAGLAVPTPASRADAATGRGQRLVEQALETLERRINVRAEVRQQISCGGKPLRGTGSYWQQGAGNGRRTRWAVKTLVAGHMASLVQVFDGRYLWTDRQLQSRRAVERLDMTRVLQELSPETGQGAPDARQDSWQTQQARARGGLAGLLAELLDKFQFEHPVHVRVDDAAALAVIGRWKRDGWEKVANRRGPGIPQPDNWPQQLPHHVLLIFGQADLFPYVLEFRRASDAALADVAAGFQSAPDPLTRYELFAVEFAAQMDPELFRYTPAENGVVDVTGAVLQRLTTPRPIRSARRL